MTDVARDRSLWAVIAVLREPRVQPFRGEPLWPTSFMGYRLHHPHHHPAEGGDAMAHWMMFDCSRAPGRPNKTFPDTPPARRKSPTES